MRNRTRLSRSRMAASIALATVAFSLGVPLAAAPPARADYAPQANDVVGVGSGLLQPLLDFGDDGDPEGDTGYNTAGNLYKVVGIDATADANGRAAYLNNSTTASPLPLDPTVVLRGGTYPVERPATGAAGIAALLADTSPADPLINFAMTTSPPTATQIAQATSNGWGGLQTVGLGEEELEMVADQAATNAPPGLSAQQLVQIYQCQDTQWTQVGGTSANTIIPAIPPPGSETRSTFLNDLQAANGGTPITLGACVITVAENDPTGVTGNADPADVIEPFDTSLLNLWNGTSGDTDVGSDPDTGYFHDPTAAYPGGASLSAGVVQLDGAPSDDNPDYDDIRSLYVVYRSTDQDSTTPWQPGGTLNWAQTLFCDPGGPTPFFASAAGQILIAEAGIAPAYFCGAAPTTCTPLNIMGPGQDKGVVKVNPMSKGIETWQATCGTPPYIWNPNPGVGNPVCMSGGVVVGGVIPASAWTQTGTNQNLNLSMVNNGPATENLTCTLVVKDNSGNNPLSRQITVVVVGTK